MKHITLFLLFFIFANFGFSQTITVATDRIWRVGEPVRISWTSTNHKRSDKVIIIIFYNNISKIIARNQPIINGEYSYTPTKDLCGDIVVTVNGRAVGRTDAKINPLIYITEYNRINLPNTNENIVGSQFRFTFYCNVNNTCAKSLRWKYSIGGTEKTGGDKSISSPTKSIFCKAEVLRYPKTPGNYTLSINIVLDGKEYNCYNENFKVQKKSIFGLNLFSANAYPDLISSSGNLQIKKNSELQQISISNLKIENKGNKESPNTKSGIFLSTDQVFDNTDKKIGSIDVEALAAGSSTLKQADVSINSNTLSEGKYYVGVIVDSENSVQESDEDNNVYYWTSPVVSIDAPPSSSCICDIPSTAKLLICENFQNRKDGAITPQSVDWRLWDAKSADGIVTTNSSGEKSLLVQTTNNQDCDALLLLGNRQQGTYELSWKMYIPSGNGGYFNMQSDQNKISHTFEVFLDKGVTSLKINNVDYPSSVKYNSDAWNAIKLILDIDNQTVQLYINNQKAAVIFYPDGQIGALDFFALQDIKTQYWVDDICFFKTGESLPNGKPDLTVQEGFINIINNNGLEVQINNLKIINQGKATANASQAIVYASTNNSITTGDIQLGTIDVESLAPNSTTTKQFKYVVNQNLAPGEYYIGLLLDPSNIIDEEQEGNNMYYWPNNKLQVTNQSSCPTPSKPYIKGITSTAFYLDWNLDPTVDRYIAQLSSDQGQSWYTIEFFADGSPVKNGIVYYNYSPGNKYFFRFKSKCGNLESDWSPLLEINLPTNSANDEPCNAQSIAGDGYSVLGNLSSSSLSNYSFPCAPGGRDVWFKINSKATSMRIEVRKIILVPGSDFALAVYTGGCDGLQLVECNDDGGSELFPMLTLNNLTIGKDYYIRVWDSKGLGKDFWINAYQSGQGNNSFQSIPQAIENPINRELISEIKNHNLQRGSSEFENNQLTVIPNPSNGVFVVNYQGDQIIGNAKLILRDFLGRICYQQEITVESSSNTYHLSIDDVPNGVYSISLLGFNGKGLSTKLMISK
jgi:hypothetical protein